MRGQALLNIGFLLTAVVVSATVYLLATLTALAGGAVFALTAVVAIATFGLYILILTKLGY